MLHSIVHDELLLSVGDVPDAEDSSFTVIRATVHVELRQSSWTSLSYGNSYGGISAAKIVTTLRKMELKLHEFTERIIFDTSLLECIGEVKVARSSPPISIPVNVSALLVGLVIWSR